MTSSQTSGGADVPLPRRVIRPLNRRRADRLLVRTGSPVPDGPRQRFVFHAQLRAQPPNVDVDRPRPAVVVVTPHVREQLFTAEPPSRIRICFANSGTGHQGWVTMFAWRQFA